MIVYPETKIRCLSCKWIGERKELMYEKKGTEKEEKCPKCNEPLVRTDSGQAVLIDRCASTVSP